MADEDNEYNSLFVGEDDSSHGEDVETAQSLEEELKEIEKLTKDVDEDKKIPEKEAKKEKESKDTKDDTAENGKKKLKLGGVKNQFLKISNALKTTIKKSTTQHYLYIVKVLIIILLLLGSILMVLISYSEYKERRKDVIEITQDTNNLNNTNFVYLNNEFFMEDSIVNLKKMKLDTVQTIFYFDKPIDVTKYKPILVDYVGKTYYYNKNYGDEIEQKVISFEGLDEGVQKFNLIFDNIENPDESVIFKFELTDEFVRIPTRYISNDIPELNSENDDAFDVVVTNGIFSSAISKVSFIAKYKSDKINYRMKPAALGEGCVLTEKGSIITSRSELDKVTVFADENVIIGTLFFDPVSSLNSKVNVDIKNVAEYYDIGREIPLKPLLMRDENIFELGQYEVTIEGAKKYDDAYVVVLHAVDNLYSPPEPTIEITKDKFGRDVEKIIPPETPSVENPERVIPYVKSHMNVVTKDGEMFTVYGEQKYSQEGSDIVFRDERVLDLTSENIQFVIDEITFDVPTISFEIDLNEQAWYRVDDNQQFLNFVKQSFYSRLQYKSSEIVRSRITGFSDEVLDETMRYYEPVVPDKKANYDISIISYSKYDGGYLAIVHGEWYAVVDGKSVRMNKEHKIKVEVTDDGFLIVGDEIVN